MNKDKYIAELQQQLADIYGVPVEELAGANVCQGLRILESEGYPVYWGCVESRVSESDTFPTA